MVWVNLRRWPRRDVMRRFSGHNGGRQRGRRRCGHYGFQRLGGVRLQPQQPIRQATVQWLGHRIRGLLLLQLLLLVKRILWGIPDCPLLLILLLLLILTTGLDQLGLRSSHDGLVGRGDLGAKGELLSVIVAARSRAPRVPTDGAAWINKEANLLIEIKIKNLSIAYNTTFSVINT